MVREKFFEKLVATKNIAGTFQEQDAFKTVFNPDYETSKLQIVRFDQCFKKLPKDARGGKLLQLVFMFKDMNLWAIIITLYMY